MAPSRSFRRLPLTPLAPALVVVVGVAVAVFFALFGLRELRRTSDALALEKAARVASAVAIRLRGAPSEDRADILETVSRRASVELVLVDQLDRILVDASSGSPAVAPLLLAQRGFEDLPTGRSAFATRQLADAESHLAVVAFVHAPATPTGAGRLLRTTFVLAALLVGVAAYVAWVLSRNAAYDVAFVQREIAEMSRGSAQPIGQRVAVRALDQVGVLTASFNMLVERFDVARRAYEADLEQANALDQARGRFLAALSHELRTPLNAILGFADLLLSEVEGPLTDSAREDLEVIRSSGGHLRGLIDDILDLSAMETGSLRLERSLVDVGPVLDEVVREGASLAQGRALTVTREGAARAEAFCDPRRLRQIAQNLVSNAVKFTPRGSVRVVVTDLEDDVEIAVVDTGPGIAATEIAAIFEDYGQVGDVASRRKGTGLGLSIARRLTNAHGGSLVVESVVGEGSTFRVRMPKDEREPASSRRSLPS